MLNYKILIVRNRFNKNVNVSKGLEWFKKNAGLDIQVEEISTDFDLTFKPVGNKTYHGVVADNYYNELKKIVPEGKYNAVCLYYGNKAPRIRVSYAEDYPLYPDTDVIQVVKDDNGLTLNHELFHTFFKKLNRKGIAVTDCMDVTIVKGVSKPYYNDKNLNAKESNRTFALEALKPYWNDITAMNQPDVVTLTRYSDNGVQTLGTLVYKTFKCDTLERPWKNNQTNISCIPKGTYTVDWTWSPKFMRATYEIKNVPNRSGVRFHKGNYFFDVEGCILLGNGYKDINVDGQVDVINSTIIITAFEDFMQRKSFKLIVK